MLGTIQSQHMPGRTRSRKKTTVRSSDEGYMQRCYLAVCVSSWCNKGWGRTALPIQIDQTMSALLMSGYLKSFSGGMQKSEAWDLVEVQNIKTARKYVARAVDLGLFEVRKSEDDARVDLLFATDILNKAAEQQFAALFHYLQTWTAALTQRPIGFSRESVREPKTLLPLTPHTLEAGAASRAFTRSLKLAKPTILPFRPK